MVMANTTLDKTGTIKEKMVLVLVDAHSKLIEAVCTPNATSAAVIEELRGQLTRFGLPGTILTDNGTCLPELSLKIF